MLISKMT